MAKQKRQGGAKRKAGHLYKDPSEMNEKFEELVDALFEHDGKIPNSDSKIKEGGKKFVTVKQLISVEGDSALNKEILKNFDNNLIARTTYVSLLWGYVRLNDLQNPKNKREIISDPILKRVFGKSKFTMFEVGKLFDKAIA